MIVAQYNPIQYDTLVAGSNFSTPPTLPVKKAGSTHTNTSKKGVPKDLWSHRLGHPSEYAIRHFPEAAVGVEVTDLRAPKSRRGEPKPLNEVRELATAKQQISRRTDRSSKFAGI